MNELRFQIRIYGEQKVLSLNDIRLLVRQKRDEQNGKGLVALREERHFVAGDHFSRKAILEEAWMMLERLGDPMTVEPWEQAIKYLIDRSQEIDKLVDELKKHNNILNLCQVQAMASELSRLLPVLRSATVVR